MRIVRTAILCATALLLNAVSDCAAGTVLKYTASYYRIHADEYVDKEVKLYVVSLHPIPGLDPDKLPKGYRAFAAHTAYEGKYGEMIGVLVPEDDVEKVLRRYGTSLDLLNLRNTRKMEGTLKEFREKDKRDFLVLLPRSGPDDDASTGDARTEKDAKDQDADKGEVARPARGAASRPQYPTIKDGKLFTGDDGVPVEDVIKYLRKEGKILF